MNNLQLFQSQKNRYQQNITKFHPLLIQTQKNGYLVRMLINYKPLFEYQIIKISEIKRRKMENKTKTLISIILIQICVGIVNTWGTISVYAFSYFHLHQPEVKINDRTGQKIAMLALIPMGILTLMSNFLSVKIGQVNLIRISTAIWIFSTIAISIYFSYLTFMVFVVFINSSVAGMLIVPCLKCIYSYYLSEKNKMTGLVLGSCLLGNVFWSIFISGFSNPTNEIPVIQNQQQGLRFFSQQICERFRIATLISFWLISSILVFSSVWVSYCQEDHEENRDSIIDDQLTINTANQITDQLPIKLLIKDRIFIYLMLTSLFSNMYNTYIMINAKIIFMEVVEDDHAITVGIMIMMTIGAVTSLLWGFFSQNFSYGYTVLVFLIVDLAVKIYFSIIHNISSFYVGIVLMGLTQLGFLVFVSPILIDRFGLANASHLFPLKSLSLIFSGVVGSLLRLILSSLSNSTFLYLLASFSLIPILLLIPNFKTLNRMKNKGCLEFVNKRESNIKDSVKGSQF